ncbi:MAG: pyridoxal phosphate-dependent aminotransferase [Thermodesulfobacteriota bacterium]
MPVAKKILKFIQSASWIREMFEAGNRLKAEIGPENVFDFTLGNPDLAPPAEFRAVLRELAEDETPGRHGYMPQAGWPEVREKVAEFAAAEYGVPIKADGIVMTVGAGGGLNVILKTVLDPGDEVIVPQPYFVEYDFYLDNHQGVIKRAATNEDFSLNVDNVAAQVTDKTKAVLINSPHNPTGVVYSEENLIELSRLLAEVSRKNGRPVVLVSDEPYRKIVYDGVKVPSVFAHYDCVLSVTSYSKDLSLPGERIGFIAVHPDIPRRNAVLGGLVLNNRILGFVNAPSLMQRAVARLQGRSVDVNIYQKRRDLFVQGLREAGYELTVPQGAFYLFPKSPLADDVAFIRELQKENILAVPGSGFFGPGHFRLIYCLPEDTIARSLPGFKRARERVA